VEAEMSEKAVRLTGLTRDMTVLEKGTSKTVTSNAVSITVAVSVKKAVIYFNFDKNANA